MHCAIMLQFTSCLQLEVYTKEREMFQLEYPEL